MNTRERGEHPLPEAYAPSKVIFVELPRQIGQHLRRERIEQMCGGWPNA